MKPIKNHGTHIQTVKYTLKFGWYKNKNISISFCWWEVINPFETNAYRKLGVWRNWDWIFPSTIRFFKDLLDIFIRITSITSKTECLIRFGHVIQLWIDSVPTWQKHSIVFFDWKVDFRLIRLKIKRRFRNIYFVMFSILVW